MREKFTLYLELSPGEKADFEVVGLTAAAFAETVKEIAYILEPGVDIRLEFDSGTEGSLKLNAILKLFERGKTKEALLVIIAAVALSLGNDIKTYGVGKFLSRR